MPGIALRLGRSFYMPRSELYRLLGAAVTCAALAACAPKTALEPPKTPATKAPGTPAVPMLRMADARVAMGHVERPREGDGLASLRHHLEAAMALGDRAAARAALSHMLTRAQILHALAVLSDTPERSPLADIRREVASRAVEVEAKWLLIDAAKPLDDGVLDAQALEQVRARILAGDIWLGSDLHAAASKRWGDDPAIALALERNRPWRTEAPELPPSLLARLGARAIVPLTNRMRRAVRQDDLPGAREAARLLVREDPLNVQAQLLLLLNSKRLQKGPAEGLGYRALLGEELATGQTFARLSHHLDGRRRAHPAHRIAYALHALQLGLSAECLEAVDGIGKRDRKRKPVRIAATTLEALCKLEGNDGTAFQTWQRKARAERSFYVIEHLVGLQEPGEQGPRRHAADWALQRALERDYERGDQSGFLRLFTDDGTAGPLRARARKRLVKWYDETLVDACRTRTPAECEKLFDAEQALVDPSEAYQSLGEALELLADVEGYELPWDELTYAWPREALPQVLGWLRRAGAQASSPSHLQVSLYAMLRDGDGERCLEQLDRYGELFTLDERIRLRLAALSIQQGADPDEVLETDWVRPPFMLVGPQTWEKPKAEVVERIREEQPGGHPTALYHRARRFHDVAALEESAADLRKVIAVLQGEERASLEAALALLEAHQGRLAEARALAARVERAAPGRTFVHLLWAHLHEVAKERAQAHARYQEALVDDPRDRAVFEALLRTLDPGAESAQVRRFLDTVAAHFYQARRKSELLADLPAIDMPTLQAVLAPYDQATFELGERGIRNGKLDARAGSFLESHLRKLEADSEVLTWARRAVAYAHNVEPDERRDWAWWYFLAGDAKQAAELASEAEGDQSGNPLVMLRTARQRGEIDDALAVKLWREHGRWSNEPLKAVEALQRSGSSDAGVQHYLCRLLVDGDLPQPATRHCAEAWRSGRRNEDLAGAVSWLVIVAPDDAARVGLTPEAVFEHPGARHEVLGGAWMYNRAASLFDRDQAPEGQAQVDAAWRAGWGVAGGNVPEKATTLLGPPTSLALRFVIATSEHINRLQRMSVLTSYALFDVEPLRMEHYGRAALSEGLGSDPNLLAAVPGIIDMAELIRDDVRRRALTIEQARAAVGPLQHGDGSVVLEMADKHPRSSFLQLAASEQLLGQGKLEKSWTLSETLLSRFPDNASALLQGIRVHLMSERKDQARVLLARMRGKHPQDPRVPAIAGLLDDAVDLPLPKTLATAEAFDRHSAGSLERLLSGKPERHASLEQEIEVFAPEGYEPGLADELTFALDDGVQVRFRRIPRATRCAAMECMEMMLPPLESAGFAVKWSREIALPLGPAGQALLKGRGRPLLLMVVPVRQHVFMIMAGGPTAAVEQRVGEVVAIAQSLRFLSSAIHASRGEALRGRLWSLPDAATRLRARMRAHGAEPKKGCPIAKLLDGLEGGARGELLADLLLSSERVEQRRALLRCAQPGKPEAQPLGVIALLDEDDGIHRFGEATVREFPAEALQDARAMIGGYDSRAGTGAGLGRDLVPYGMLEALLALPDKQRKAFCKSLLQSSDKELHLLGLAAANFVPGIAPPEILQADVRSAPPNTAVLAVQAANRTEDATLVDALRTRLSSLHPPTNGEELALHRALAYAIARRLDPQDSAVLDQAAARVRDASAEGARHSFEWMRRYAATHHHGVAVAAGKKPPSDRDVDRVMLHGWTSEREVANAGTKRRVTAALLYRSSLADLAPAGGYIYARLPQPAVAVAMGKRLLREVDFGAPSETYNIRRRLSRRATRHGIELLSPGGGLDLKRPIECLAGQSTSGFACTAYVEDIGRVRSLLGQRPVGTDAGPALVLHTVRRAMGLPAMVAATLGRFHRQLYPEVDTGGAFRTRLLGERLRTREAIFGHELERYATLEVHEGRGVMVDHEHYLLVRDRLFIFGGRHMAELVLGGVEGESLARSKSFKRARGYFDHAQAIQGAWTASDGSADASAVALGLSATGAELEWHYSSTPDPGSVERLAAALPAGSVASLVSGYGRILPSLGDSLEDLEASAASGQPPPGWLLHIEGPAAFAWYPARGGALWERWAIALPSTDAVVRRLERRGEPLPEPVGPFAGVWLMRRGSAIVIASEESLLAEPQEKRHAGGDLFRLRVSPQKVADAFEQLVARSDDPDVRDWTRMEVGLVRALERLDLHGRRARRGGTMMRGRLDFRVSGGSSSELDLVKQWLHTKNSLQLPTTLVNDSARAPITYVFGVDDAKRLLERRIGRDPRITLSARDGKTLELHVRPGPRPQETAAEKALDARRRKKLLGPSALVDTRAPALVALAKRVTSRVKKRTPRALAEQIVRWLHDNMHYEVTPEWVGTQELVSSLRGDCSEYSSLAVAMLRALGVPAELQHGLMVDGNTMVAHAWVRYHDGQGFREIDPTNDLIEVGSHHVPVSLADVLGLLALDRLKVSDVRVQQ